VSGFLGVFFFGLIALRVEELNYLGLELVSNVSVGTYFVNKTIYSSVLCHSFNLEELIFCFDMFLKEHYIIMVLPQRILKHLLLVQSNRLIIKCFCYCNKCFS